MELVTEEFSQELDVKILSLIDNAVSVHFLQQMIAG